MRELPRNINISAPLAAWLNELRAVVEQNTLRSTPGMRIARRPRGTTIAFDGKAGGGGAIDWQGEHDKTKSYAKGAIVIRKTAADIANGRFGGTYIAKKAVPANTDGPIEPNEGEYWETFARGAWSRLMIKEVGNFTPKAVAVAGGTLAFENYFYKITAVVAGVEVESEEVSAMTSSDTSNRSIKLTWNAVPGATGYNFYRTITAGIYPASSKLSGGTVTVTEFTDTGIALIAGTPPGGAYIDIDSARCIGSDGKKHPLYIQEIAVCENGVQMRRLVLISDSY